MKKIMFNDKCGLTHAVLDGRKTQTRRIIKCRKTFRGEWVAGFNIHIIPPDKKVVGWPCMYDADEGEFEGGEILPKYKIGEVVAIAQSYKDLGYLPIALNISPKDWRIVSEPHTLGQSKGWNNKMLVRAEACKHHIRITDVRIERLQDVSDEDCIKEGVEKGRCGSKYTHFMDAYYVPGDKQPYSTPQEAFAILVDKVSGKGTWDSNPYVWIYDFELVK